MIRNRALQSGIVLSVCLLISTVSAIPAVQDSPTQVVGPYTVYVLSEDVYRIEDANAQNPAGLITDKDGKVVHMNISSDMYLVSGKNRALLIDLSNDIDWDDTAAESLRTVVSKRVGEREFFITLTHRHGDHMGMLHAFAQDPKARFWVPEAEFRGVDVFPKERTEFFAENASMDRGGGFIIDTMEVPGHTDHSTVFFLKNKNLIFTGDAIGAGRGVWLFNYESFIKYRESIDNLIAYIENPENRIHSEKLEIHGGHAWQRVDLDKLTIRYVYDMRTLIERIGMDTAESEGVSVQVPFLDTNFKYGTAAITWNKAAATKYVESVCAE